MNRSDGFWTLSEGHATQVIKVEPPEIVLMSAENVVMSAGNVLTSTEKVVTYTEIVLTRTELKDVGARNLRHYSLTFRFHPRTAR